MSLWSFRSLYVPSVLEVRNLPQSRCLLLLALALALLVTGCSSLDVSADRLFAPYVGAAIALQRPVILVTPSGNPATPEFLPRTSGAKYAMLVDDNRHPASPDVRPQIAAQLPAGHIITLQSVREEITLDRQDIVAYGRTRLPGHDREVTFAYHWGQSWELWPAPWEPATVKTIRQIDRPRPPRSDNNMHDKRSDSLFSR